MRFVLKIVAVVTIIILNLSFARAIEVSGTNEQYLSLIQTFVSEKVQPVVELLPVKQQQLLNQVQVEVVENMHPNAMALALDETPPKVLINARFIQGLSVYSAAHQIAIHENSPQFVEQYLEYYFAQTITEHHGISVLSPQEWVGIDGEYADDIMRQQHEVLEGALLDILLHELGHHVEKAFYSQWANQYERDTKERLADRWADRIKQEYFKEVNPLGRLISIAYIFEKDRWAILSDDQTLPRTLPWVVNHLPKLCDDSSVVSIVQFCKRLDSDIARYMSADRHYAYLERIEQGEDFARFPLAQILMAKNNFVDACSYFNESLIYGQVSRAAIYVGWCYQKGYLEPSPPDAQVLAISSQRGGIGYGYTDKRAAFRLF